MIPKDQREAVAGRLIRMEENTAHFQEAKKNVAKHYGVDVTAIEKVVSREKEQRQSPAVETKRKLSVAITDRKLGRKLNEDWRDEAACADAPKHLFFEPEREDGKAGGYTPRGFFKLALAICAECPVKTECLAYALEKNERYGVWGGMTAFERELLVQGKLRKAA